MKRSARNNDGFALISAFAGMIVVATVVGLIAYMTTSDLRQARSGIVQMQARAVAEAGEVYGRYAMKSAAQPDIRTSLRGRMTINADPLTQWIIPAGEWSAAAADIESILNDTFDVVPANELNGIGSAAVRYSMSNFRGGTRSRSSQVYLVDYRVESTGTAADGARRVEDLGVLEVQLGRPSLSQYLFLVEDASGMIGFFPTGTRFNGPVHANSNWGFQGQPEFLDTITTAADGAYYYNCSGGDRRYVRGDSRAPCTVPVFQKGFTRSAPYVDLPTSTLHQARAALGMDPEGTDTPTTAQICAIFPGRCTGSSLPNGVYLPNAGGAITGGIYVQGNASEVVLDGSSRDGRQIYRIRQGTRTWTIELDFNMNRTSVTDSATGVSTTYTGVPNGTAPLGTGGPTGQIYVTGRIDSLRGPARGTGTVNGNSPDHPVPDAITPALSLETQLHVTAVNKIDLTSDLVYECDPTAIGDPAYTTKFPRCNRGSDPLETVLGVMSQKDNVEISAAAPSQLYLWGSYLAGTSGKGLSVANYSTRLAGKLRLFGGLIQSADQLRGRINSSGAQTSGYQETFDYDLRFANGSVAPPNFPTVRVFDVQTLIPVALGFREY